MSVWCQRIDDCHTVHFMFVPMPYCYLAKSIPPLMLFALEGGRSSPVEQKGMSLPTPLRTAMMATLLTSPAWDAARFLHTHTHGCSMQTNFNVGLMGKIYWQGACTGEINSMLVLAANYINYCNNLT